MKKHVPICVLFSLVMPFTSVRGTQEDDQFEQIAHDYIEGYLAANPEDATELGDHWLDDKYERNRGDGFDDEGRFSAKAKLW